MSNPTPDELYTDETNGDLAYIAYVINAEPIEAVQDEEVDDD